MTTKDPKQPSLVTASSDSVTDQPHHQPSLATCSSDSVSNQPQHSKQTAVPGPAKIYRPAGQPTTHINPKKFRPGDMIRVREEQQEARNRDTLCQLCSSAWRDVCHHHFSTQQLREFSAKYRSLGTFNCPICKTEEPVELPTNVTRRLLLSSSTLFNVWENPNLNVDTHFEMEAVVGGRVRDLTRALDKLYLRDKPNRLEIIAVCSINNIGDGQSPDQIIAEMQEMKDLLSEHSKDYHHDPPSFVTFATCILPPKYCAFAVPDNVPELREWVPRPNFVNRAENIENLNKAIQKMNAKEGLEYPGLHLWGMKYMKSGKRQHKFNTRAGTAKVWRETEVRRKLHFTADIKLRIMTSIQKIFTNNAKV